MLCPQPSDHEISEDCLTVNVYTKNVDPTADQPVFFYIHGGALQGGSALESGLGAEYLIDRDVVIVTAHYRVNAFGFLSTGTKEAPGNIGFKDQVLALKWVQTHIKVFGGNPNLVTLFGQSAGARSVAVHLASPMSADLFHRAIVMSGSTTAQWDMPHDTLELAQRQARILGCPDNSPEAIVSCMKNISMRDLALSVDQLGEWTYHPILKYFPVIEGDFGQERFLIEDPKVSFATGNFNKVPIITGITRDEFVGPAWDVLIDDNVQKDFETNFNEVAPICFNYERGTEKSRNASSVIRQKFIPDNMTKDSIRELNIVSSKKLFLKNSIK